LHSETRLAQPRGRFKLERARSTKHSKEDGFQACGMEIERL
jgi:hypothetical protein